MMVAIVAACSSNAVAPPDVNGDYVATTFSVVQNGVPINELQAGAHVTISLASDGTTTGILFLPHGNADSSDLILDLSGTWTIQDRTVRFSNAADSFVRDMSFMVVGSALVGDYADATTRVRLVLNRTL
jgi:hypothetical protein